MSITKVTILLGSFSGGGSERAMINFSNALLAQGITVDVIVGRSEGPFRFLLSDKANVIDFKAGMLRSVLRIRSYLKECKSQIVFSSQLHVNIAALLATRLMKNGPKVVIREATTPSKQSKSSGRKNFIRASRLLFKRADHIVAVSDDSRRDCISFYGIEESKITTVYAPFITGSFLEQSQEEVEHRWFDENQKMICSMGRVMPVKDFATLIKAFALAKEKVDCRLMIIGDTDRDAAYYERLKTLTKSLNIDLFVDFIGFKSNPFPYLKKSNVYVLSSLFEGLPGSLVQALALGCQIVSTDCESGPREILRDGLLGELVPVGDESQMADAILRSIEKPSSSELSLDKVSDFTEQKALDSLLSVFESTL